MGRVAHLSWRLEYWCRCRWCRKVGEMQRSKKVLIVDDDLELLQSLSEQLRLHEEFEVAAADSGGAALEAIKNEHFDAILLDVGLPDMDGREVIARPVARCREARKSASAI